MKSTRTESRLALVSALLLALAAACGPLGGSSEPPPYLELSVASVTFDAGEDSGILEVRNTGGGLISFTAVVSAESGGVTWLKADPTGGTVQGGTSKAILLTVTNREALQPGTYTGQVSVEAENVDGRSLLVTLNVGQPILETDPTELLDFDAAATSRSLQVKNTGDGTLVYSVLLPGVWITTTAPLQKTLAAGQSDTLVLGVDRDAVPWYGAGEDEILITSNGLDDDGHTSTAKLLVQVTTDANCGSDADCTLPGYFCDDADGDGACALRRDNGSACQSDEQCSSALCVEDVCCNVACGGPCESCALAATKGTCSPVTDGTGCDDGLVCTENDACEDGVCASGPAMDCATFDNPCGPGACSESAGGCTGPDLGDRCVIDGDCLDDGDWHPEVPCLRCLPGVASDDWSIIPDRCLVDGICYETGDEIGGPCSLCDPATPESATADVDEACEDGDPCTHTDVCTADGVCGGTPYVCDDGLDCTTDACLGDGGCSVEVAQDACVIDDACIADGAFSPGSGDCALCAPGYAQDAWTSQPDGLDCDDGDPCTENDSCLEGLCVAQAKDCDNGADCSEDSCVDGECVHDIGEQTCLIEGVCYDEGISHPDFPCQACLPAESQVAWSGYNLGTPCDLPNAVAQCGEEGDCVLIDCMDTIHGDCNEISSDGCEVELWQDLMHCGTCDDPCTQPNAWTACAGGQCSFVACHEGYTSCDGQETTGCEAHTATDPVNCGECGLLCDTNNPAKVGVCEESACALVFCEADTFNLDGDPSNGCECVVGGEEICNDTDDDCDGEVDEGFDLMTDLENCGGCGQVCELPDAAGFTCVNGACLLTECPPGLYDRNGDPLDGCEHELLFNDELWVDALNGGGPDADGSEEHPFATIQEAIDAASPSNLIHVAEGGYLSGLIVDKVGLSIVGAGADAVTLANPQYGTGILVTADDVTIAGLKLSGGAVGIHVQGDPLLKLQGGLIADVIAEMIVAEAETGQSAAGVLVEYTDDLTVSFTTVTTVQGGSSYYEGPGGGDASGVRVVHSDDSRLVNTQIADLIGGDGGVNYAIAVPPAVAAGLHLESSSGALIRGNTVTDATGGQGNGATSSAKPNTGGIGAGTYLETSPGALVDGNSFDSIFGGNHGCGICTDVAPQYGYGIYLDEVSAEATVEQTNTMDGDPIVYLFGVEDVVLEGLSLVAESNPTNLGKIVVRESNGVTVMGNEIAHFQGATGQNAYAYCADPEDGQPGRGIYLDHCTGCAATDNVISDIRGGRGGALRGAHCPGGDGGNAAAVEVSECLGAQINGNTAATIFGGGRGYCEAYKSDAGVAAAYLIRGSQGIEFSNNLAQHIRVPHWNGLGGFEPLTCVYADDTEPFMIDHLTCRDVGDSVALGYGVAFGDDQLSQVHLRNSIISSVTGHGVKGLTGVPGMLMAWFSAFHDCGMGLFEDATLNSCIEEDPLFVLPDEGNLHLQPASLCIDAGNPSTDCNLEPVPNGCAVNLGAYGGTTEAASAVGVDHCSPCP